MIPPDEPLEVTEPRSLAAVLDDQFEVRALYPVGFVEALQAQVARQYEAIERAAELLAEADLTAWHPACDILEAAGYPAQAQKLFNSHRMLSRAAEALAAADRAVVEAAEGGTDGGD